MAQSENDCVVNDVKDLLWKRVVVTEPPNDVELVYFVVPSEQADAFKKRLTVNAPVIKYLAGVSCGEEYTAYIGKKSDPQAVITYRLIRIE